MPMTDGDDYGWSVFINAPFDNRYRRIFDAIVFTIIDCGFTARCALEVEDGSQVRLEKIFSIISGCRYSIHDLSRTQLDSKNRLPRFNMPLELGMFLGAKRFGNGRHKTKNCIILDTERYRYQKFISDIAGQDPKGHSNDPVEAIKVVRNWLLHQAPQDQDVPAAKIISRRLALFEKEKPALCKAQKWDKNNLTFKEKVFLMYKWISSTPL